MAATSPACGQVFELGTGSSDLFEAHGGTLLVRGPSYNATIGAGVVAGRFVGGETLEKSYRGALYNAGTQTIPCNLPTDIFDTDHFLLVLGASVKKRIKGTDFMVFGGATSKDFGSPFFDGVRAEQPVAVAMIDRPFSQSLTAMSEIIVASQTTALGSLAWRPNKSLRVALTGGVGTNQPYGAASFTLTERWIDVKAAYILAGSQFRRAAATELLTPEPDRENLEITLRPTKFLTVSAVKQNYLSPESEISGNAASSVEQVSANLKVEKIDLSATAFRSTYAGRTGESVVYSAARQITHAVRVAGSYMQSQAETAGAAEGEPTTRLFTADTAETLTSRWSLNQTLSTSNGQTNVGFGGSFLSNLATVSLDYENYYVPSRTAAPFEQAMILNVEMNAGKGVSLHGSTFVAPDGRLLYTLEAHTLLSRQEEGAVAPRTSMGSMVLRGCVRDTEGRPVMGAAVIVGQLALFTSSDGCFSIRERRAHTHPLRVVLDAFMDGGRYRVVSSPDTMQSGTDVPETVIVVARIAGAR